MVDKFPNLPGVVANFNDGNLAPEIPASGSVTVIIGTGSSGPSGRLATASGAGGSARLFGSGSLARGAIEAFQGGAESVSGFRILATAGRIDGIGNGISITTTGKGSDALDSLELLFDGTVLKVYDSATGTLVFASDGSADLGIVEATGATSGTTLRISAEVASHGGLTDNTVAYDEEDAALANVPTLDFGAGFNAARIVADDTYIQIQDAAGAVFQIDVVSAAGQKVVLTAKPANLAEADVTAVIRSKTTAVSVATAIANRLGTAATRDISVLDGSDTNGLTHQEVTADSGKLNTAAAEVEPSKMNTFEGLIDAALALEGADVDYAVLVDGFLDDPHIKDAGETILTADAASAVTDAGDPLDQIVLTASAAVELDAAGKGAAWIVITQARGAAFGTNHDTDELVRTARILNHNPAGTRLFLDRELSMSIGADGALTAGQAPTCKIVKDGPLFYLREEEAGKFWYPTAVDPDGKIHHEINFGYRLARFCEEKTSNESFCLGVIGMNPPVSHYSPAAIAGWYGKSPDLDSDTGLPTSTGTGLLGQKILAGTSAFTAGFYATANGSMDDDSVLLDANDEKIDMGKFLSIVASNVLLTNLADADGLGYICSGASLYAGLVSSLPPWSAATGKAFDAGISVPTRLAKRRQNALAGLGYVIFDQPRGSNLTVVDAPSAAMSASDFTRNMTTRIVGEAIGRIRAVARPFLGEPLSAPRKVALDTSIGSALGALQADSDAALESFSYSLTQTPREAVTGVANLTLSLKVIGELRRIVVTVSLSL